MKTVPSRWSTYSVLIVAAMLSVAAMGSLRAQVLYSQTFDYTNAAVSGATSLVGWSSYVGSTAYDVTTARADANGSVKLYGALGSPHDTLGYLSLFNSSPTPASVSFATFATGLNLTNVGTVTWQMNSDSTTPNVRLLVQVGGVWYASGTAFTTSAGSVYTGNDLNLNTVTMDTKTVNASTETSWYVMTFVAGSSMSLAGTTTTLDLATSTVTGVGFYSDINPRYKTVNLDTLMVSSVPEPASVVLLGLGLGGLILSRRRMLRGC